MPAVLDTGPATYLVLVGAVEVLPALYGGALAPPAVIAELLHPRTPEPVRLWAASLPAWAAVRAPEDPGIVVRADAALRITGARPGNLAGLGAGEREAIPLALELGLTLVCDDAEARGAARAAGVPLVIGTLGVLQAAHARGMLEIRPTLERLAPTSFRRRPGLLDDIERGAGLQRRLYRELEGL